MSTERNGFIVHRAIWDHDLFAGEPFDRMKAWLWLVSEAAWAERRVRGNGAPITLQRGQICHSVRFMGEAWGWDKSRVARYLDMLEKRDMIQRKTETGILVLTICNYEYYQLTPGYKRDTTETATETRPRHDRDTTETNENQEIKKSYTPPTPSRGSQAAPADAAAPLAADEEDDFDLPPIQPLAEPAKPKADVPGAALLKVYEALGGKVPKTPSPEESDFDAFWQLYPKRPNNPRKPALQRYLRARKAGHSHEAIMAGVRALAAEWRKRPKAELTFCPMATTWLNEERWTCVVPVEPVRQNATAAGIDDQQWDIAVMTFARYGQWSEQDFGPSPKDPGCRAPSAVLRKYRYSVAA